MTGTSRILLIILVVSMGSLSLGGEDAENVERIAVLPLSSLAVAPSVCAEVRKRITDSLTSRYSVEVLPTPVVDAEVRKICGEPSDWWTCLEQDQNLMELGTRLKVRVVVAGKVAAIGETQVLKLRVADIPRSTVFAEIVNMVNSNDETLINRFAFLQEGLLLPRQSRTKSDDLAWYEKWQYWTLAGAGLVIVGGILFFSFQSGSVGGWDYRTTLP